MFSEMTDDFRLSQVAINVSYEYLHGLEVVLRETVVLSTG